MQKYLSLTGHVYTRPTSPPARASSPPCRPTCQAILSQAAKDTQAYVYQQAAKLDDELLGKIKAAGVKVNEADKDAFIAASKEVYQEFGKEVPEGGKTGREGDRPRQGHVTASSHPILAARGPCRAPAIRRLTRKPAA